jgi:hypothetical protein
MPSATSLRKDSGTPEQLDISGSVHRCRREQGAILGYGGGGCLHSSLRIQLPRLLPFRRHMRGLRAHDFSI